MWIFELGGIESDLGQEHFICLLQCVFLFLAVEFKSLVFLDWFSQLTLQRGTIYRLSMKAYYVIWLSSNIISLRLS